jgi:catechol 2,3-dioxygenase-like lactoylglutathione lyase family enzyme
MEVFVSRIVKDFEDGRITRRQLVQTLAGAMLAGAGAGAAAAQAPAETSRPFRTLNFDHIAYQAPDYRRMRDFYVGLLGMTVVDDNGKDSCQLHFGEARSEGARPRAFLSVTNAATARIDHVALRIADWHTERVRAELERRGLKPQVAPGGPRDTPNYVSFHIDDPNGFDVQISGIARPGDPLYKG